MMGEHLFHIGEIEIGNNLIPSIYDCIGIISSVAV